MCKCVRVCVCVCARMSVCLCVCLHVLTSVRAHVAELCTTIIYSLYLGEGCLIVCFCGRLATVQGKNPASFEIVFAIIIRVSSRNLSENIAF